MKEKFIIKYSSCVNNVLALLHSFHFVISSKNYNLCAGDEVINIFFEHSSNVALFTDCTATVSHR